jgi:fucose permease
MIGTGFAMLQVIINPLLRVAGGEADYAFFANLSQMIFALGSAASPYLYGYLLGCLKNPNPPRNPIIRALGQVVQPGLPWISLYRVFTVALLAMAVIVSVVTLPAIKLRDDERIGSLFTLFALLKRRTVWLYFVGIVCYVGTEQGVAVWLKKFLLDYHRIEPGLADQVAVSGFWGA